jgi:hypothetical protein
LGLLIHLTFLIPDDADYFTNCLTIGQARKRNEGAGSNQHHSVDSAHLQTLAQE